MSTLRATNRSCRLFFDLNQLFFLCDFSLIGQFQDAFSLFGRLQDAFMISIVFRIV